MTCQDSFHEVAFNISFWTRNISSARILFWRGVCTKPNSFSNNTHMNLNSKIRCSFNFKSTLYGIISKAWRASYYPEHKSLEFPFHVKGAV